MSFPGVNFPAFVLQFCNYLSFANLDIFSFLPADCVVTRRRNLYYDRLLVFTLTPIAIAIVILSTMKLRHAFAPNAAKRQKFLIFYLSLLLAFS